jgi:hypothetical protein
MYALLSTVVYTDKGNCSVRFASFRFAEANQLVGAQAVAVCVNYSTRPGVIRGAGAAIISGAQISDCKSAQ